jgi:hypothetical protein
MVFMDAWDGKNLERRVLEEVCVIILKFSFHSNSYVLFLKYAFAQFFAFLTYCFFISLCRSSSRC